MRPVGLDRWVAGWFRQQLGSVWGIGRDDGEPEVVTDWNVVVRGEAEYVGVAPECCSLVVYAARGLFTESIEAFRVSGSQMLGGSYVGKGVAELHLRLLDDAVRTFKEGSEHSGVAGEDNLRIIPHLPAWPRDHVGDWRRYCETINSSHRRVFLLGVSLALVCVADLALLAGKPEPATIMATAAARLSDELGGDSFD